MQLKTKHYTQVTHCSSNRMIVGRRGRCRWPSPVPARVKVNLVSNRHKILSWLSRCYLATGCCLLVVAYWLLRTGCWLLLATGYVRTMYELFLYVSGIWAVFVNFQILYIVRRNLEYTNYWERKHAWEAWNIHATSWHHARASTGTGEWARPVTSKLQIKKYTQNRDTGVDKATVSGHPTATTSERR
jgi:hypothetical protein